MPKETTKSHKPKPPKLKLVAKKPGKIKAVLKAYVAAAEQTDCNTLNLDGAPAWAENALAEVAKVVFPSKTMPTEGEWDVEFLGELFGRQQAFARLYGGEIPMSPEMQADCAKLTQHAAAQPQTPERKARKKQIAKDFQNLANANQQVIPQLLAAVLESSHEDTLKFQKGLALGMKLVAEELDAGKIFQRYTRVFWVIGLQWQRFVKCQSVAEVHRILCAENGAAKIGSLKHFEERVAKKIGLSFGSPGRPAKAK